jgi:hypothetical protein
MEADPPFTSSMRALATKNKTKSKTKATKATVAPNPDTQVLQ